MAIAALLDPSRWTRATTCHNGLFGVEFMLQDLSVLLSRFLVVAERRCFRGRSTPNTRPNFVILLEDRLEISIGRGESLRLWDWLRCHSHSVRSLISPIIHVGDASRWCRCICASRFLFCLAYFVELLDSLPLISTSFSVFC
jgi:hypothetical protein